MYKIVLVHFGGGWVLSKEREIITLSACLHNAAQYEVSL